jgi:hypothetical protein
MPYRTIAGIGRPVAREPVEFLGHKFSAREEERKSRGRDRADRRSRISDGTEMTFVSCLQMVSEGGSEEGALSLHLLRWPQHGQHS